MINIWINDKFKINSTKCSLMFCSLFFDLWSMTLTYKLDLDVLPMQPHTDTHICRRCQIFYTHHVGNMRCDNMKMWLSRSTNFGKPICDTMHTVMTFYLFRQMIPYMLKVYWHLKNVFWWQNWNLRCYRMGIFLCFQFHLCNQRAVFKWQYTFSIFSTFKII